MRSADYLYELLRSHDGNFCKSYYIHGKRYCIGAVPPSSPENPWRSAVCRVRYQNMFAVTEPFLTDEAAWEDFLSRRYPDILSKWNKREAQL